MKKIRSKLSEGKVGWECGDKTMLVGGRDGEREVDVYDLPKRHNCTPKKKNNRRTRKVKIDHKRSRSLRAWSGRTPRNE